MREIEAQAGNAVDNAKIGYLRTGGDGHQRRNNRIYQASIPEASESTVSKCSVSKRLAGNTASGESRPAPRRATHRRSGTGWRGKSSRRRREPTALSGG